jgi:hypothetical protein
VKRLGVLLALALTAAACGGDNNVTPRTVVTEASTTAATTETTPDTGGGTAATTPPETDPAKEAIGKVTGIVPVGGAVGGAPAFEGQPVARQDVISTEPNGKVIFAVGKLLPFCQVETDSEVEVEPGDGALVAVRQGTALCRTSAAGQLKQFAAGGVVVTAADPVFLLGWDGETATVQVAQGFVRIQGNGRTAIVGANQQASSGPGGTGVDVWEPASIQDRQTRNATIDQRTQAVAAQPGSKYPALDRRRSPTLAPSLRGGAVVVAVEDESSATFVQELFGQMGSLWNVTFSAQVGADGGDIVITSHPPSGSNAIPFAEISGTTYFAATVEADPALTQAMAAFLATSLQAECPMQGGGRAEPGASCYEDVYRVQIGDDLVPLDPLANYLGLG